MKYLSVIALVVVLALSFSSTVLAQDETVKMKKEEMRKEEMKKDKEAMGAPTHAGEMKMASCSPECGFTVRSHNEGEVVEMIKMHAKKQHNMDVSDSDAKAKVKTAGHMEKREMKKETK